MSLSSGFIRRPVATTLLMMALLLVGIVAYPLLPVAPLPQVDFPTIQVTTQLPGASPETMAATVTAPLERQFAQIPGVTLMTSSSTQNVSSITVQFDLSRNIDAAAQDIQTAINAAGGQLPRTLPAPPSYRKINPADAPIMLLAVRSDVLPLTEVDDQAENILAQHLSQLNGVAQVSINGQQKPAIRVQIDPARVAALGLSLEDLRSSIVALSTDGPKGQIEGALRSFTVYANDQLTEAAQWNDAVVAYHDGAPVRVRDIGVAVDAPENLMLHAWANGQPTILLAIFKQPGANVIDTVDAIMRELPRLREALPPGIQVSVLQDRTQTIRASVDDVQFTLVLTIGLVVGVIFLFLRSFWATVIPAVTVPLSLMATLGVMYMLGYSLDNLSLMGLSIAVGFVVDDAIVMLENIVRHMEQGKPPMQAAMEGSAEIGFTIVSISLSLIAVFIPLFLMSGLVGRLFREFAITISATIVVSAFVSLTLTPMMAARLVKAEHHAQHGRFYRVVERGFDALLGGYRRTLDLALRFHLVTFLVFLMTLAATGWLFVTIPKGFFPQQDIGLLIGTVQTAPETSFEEMTRRSRAVSEVMLRDPDIEGIGVSVGATGGLTLNQARMFVTLKPHDQRQASADQIITRLRPQLARLTGTVTLLQAAQDINIGGRPTSTQYQYTLQDANFAELDAWAPRIYTRLQQLPQLRDVATDRQAGGTTLTIAIDRDEAARYGISAQLIDDTLYDAIGQRQVAQYFTQVNAYHVILEVPPVMQSSPGLLDQIRIRSPLTGQPVALSAFAHWTTAPVTTLLVAHQGQFPSVTISFNLAPGVALGDAVNAVQAAQRELGAPGSLTGAFQGSAQAFQASLASEPYLVAAAVIVIYLILGMLYESFVHPLTILSTLPSASLGALLMLRLAGVDFTIVALIGVILLIGIVKKNGIMLVDFAVQAERNEGKRPAEAIREACLLRFRPILMTTMAALLGGLPLMLGAGTGSEIRRPLGLAMVGGLLVSQVLTLYTTPVVYLYLDRLRRLLGRRSEAPAHDDGPQGAVRGPAE
ncbi:efflux RND transporter permease subunit [Plastoroseomonas hellenica]|uniref:efflux RND transporter permease subunit n=1 Tax=Plastoroseomonas hellenica TaxID=2687306 RepID=UPI001BA5DA37|nr:efflux RND transporter permease subunit [Plastoroseomonas hellenica]MBR0644603.1 MMPL family transporter [Plastoroseomonas hellenica]